MDKTLSLIIFHVWYVFTLEAPPVLGNHHLGSTEFNWWPALFKSMEMNKYTKSTCIFRLNNMIQWLWYILWFIACVDNQCWFWLKQTLCAWRSYLLQLVWSVNEIDQLCYYVVVLFSRKTTWQILLMFLLPWDYFLQNEWNTIFFSSTLARVFSRHVTNIYIFR